MNNDEKQCYFSSMCILIIMYILNELFICIFFFVYTGTSKKKNEYHEKGYYFLSLISESETHILYRFFTHRGKYFKPLFLDILMIMAYR